MAIDFDELQEKTIQSQYSNSPHIKGLIEAFKNQIDPTADIAAFYKKIFDPRTAEGVGLDIWGDIVGVIRLLEIFGNEYLGMFGQNAQNFDNAPFYNEGVNEIYKLSDAAFRELIFLKAYSNIADSTLPAVKFVYNQLLEGTVTAYKAGKMMLRLIFLTYDVPEFSIAIIRQYGFMNLGAGVGYEYYIIDPSETFGFDGGGYANFNNGIFEPYRIMEM